MSLVVEDGTAKSNAESYLSAADATAYHTLRGNTAWAAATDAERETYLRRATDYMDFVFGDRFIGDKSTTTQALAWPRDTSGEYPSDELPVALTRACAEYALRAIAGPLAPDPVYDKSGRMSQSLEQKVGPLDKKVAFTSSTPVRTRSYPIPDAIISSLVRSAGNAVYR